jgi:hypothetical protein
MAITGFIDKAAKLGSVLTHASEVGFVVGLFVCHEPILSGSDLMSTSGCLGRAKIVIGPHANEQPVSFRLNRIRNSDPWVLQLFP